MTDPKLIVMHKKIVKFFKTSLLRRAKEKLLDDFFFKDSKGFINRVIFYKQQRFKKTHHPIFKNTHRKKDKFLPRAFNVLCRSSEILPDPRLSQLPIITTFLKVLLPHTLKDRKHLTGLWVTLANEVSVPRCSRGFKARSREPVDSSHRKDRPSNKGNDSSRTFERLTEQCNGTAEQKFYTEDVPVRKDAKSPKKQQRKKAEERELPPPQRCRLSCPLPPLEFIPLEEKEFLSHHQPASVRFSSLLSEFLPPHKEKPAESKAASISLKSREHNYSKKKNSYTSAADSAGPPESLPKSIKNKKTYFNLMQLKSQLTPPQPEIIPKMKALLFEPDSLALNFDAVNAPTKIFKDEVLVQVSYSGVCGTDLFITEGKVSCGANPVILGHEISGKVYAVGSDVEHVRPGDNIAVNAYTSCCICRYCSRGYFSACVNDGLSNSIGVSKNGGWAEFVVVKKSQVHKIPPELGLDQAALVQPLSCVLSAYSKLTISDGIDILIQGLGLSGCLWASVLHSKGLRNVLVSDRSGKKRAQFESLNLGYRFVPMEDIGKYAVDVIIECTGLPISIEKAFNILNPNGQMCFFGKPNPLTEVRCIPYEIVNKEITIFGNSGNAFCFSKALDLAASMSHQYLNFDKLGVRVFDLEDYKEAFQLKKLGEVNKIMFKFDS